MAEYYDDVAIAELSATSSVTVRHMGFSHGLGNEDSEFMSGARLFSTPSKICTQRSLFPPTSTHHLRVRHKHVIPQTAIEL